MQPNKKGIRCQGVALGNLFRSIKDAGQRQKLMACDNLGKQGKSIVEMFRRKSAQVNQSVIGQQVNFVKLLRYMSREGVKPSLSVLIYLTSTILPAVFNVGC